MINADATAENKPACMNHYCSIRPHLFPFLQQRDAHEYKGRVQVFIVFLLKVLIVFLYLPLELVVEPRPGVDARSGFAKHRLQGVAKGFLQIFGVS